MFESSNCLSWQPLLQKSDNPLWFYSLSFQRSTTSLTGNRLAVVPFTCHSWQSYLLPWMWTTEAFARLCEVIYKIAPLWPIEHAHFTYSMYKVTYILHKRVPEELQWWLICGYARMHSMSKTQTRLWGLVVLLPLRLQPRQPKRRRPKQSWGNIGMGSSSGR